MSEHRNSFICKSKVLISHGRQRTAWITVHKRPIFVVLEIRLHIGIFFFYWCELHHLAGPCWLIWIPPVLLHRVPKILLQNSNVVHVVKSCPMVVFSSYLTKGYPKITGMSPLALIHLSKCLFHCLKPLLNLYSQKSYVWSLVFTWETRISRIELEPANIASLSFCW